MAETLQALRARGVCISDWEEWNTFPVERHVAQQPCDVHIEVMRGRAVLGVVESIERCESRVCRQTFVDRQQSP
jgi:hypothetical protein